MKLLAYTLKQSNVFQSIECSPNDAQQTAKQLFAKGADRILSKWKDKLILLEFVDDRSKTGGIRITNPEEVQYSKTEITYHPLQNNI